MEQLVWMYQADHPSAIKPYKKVMQPNARFSKTSELLKTFRARNAILRDQVRYRNSISNIYNNVLKKARYKVKNAFGSFAKKLVAIDKNN